MSIQGVSSLHRGGSNATQIKPEQKAANSQPIEQKTNQAPSQASQAKQATQISRSSQAAKNKPHLESEQANQGKRQPVSEQEVLNAIEKANSSINNENARFEYSIHEDTKRIMVKIVDTVNDEVIKEIPAEEVLDMVAKIWEMSGILLDEKR